MEIRIYTESMKCVGSYTRAWEPLQPLAEHPMSMAAYDGLGGGTYYYRVIGSRDGVKSPPFIGKFVILR